MFFSKPWVTIHPHFPLSVGKLQELRKRYVLWDSVDIDYHGRRVLWTRSNWLIRGKVKISSNTKWKLSNQNVLAKAQVSGTGFAQESKCAISFPRSHNDCKNCVSKFYVISFGVSGRSYRKKMGHCFETLQGDSFKLFYHICSAFLIGICKGLWNYFYFIKPIL